MNIWKQSVALPLLIVCSFTQSLMQQ